MRMSLKQRHHLFTILAVLVVSAGGFLTWRASATTSINPGYDQFTTPDDGQSTEAWTLPEGFFRNAEGYDSNRIDNLAMSFKGGNPVPNFGADTVVQRQDFVTPGTGQDTTRILLKLSLVGGGANPQVTATFNNGTPSVTYDVSVRESQIAPSSGHMQFLADSTFNILDWEINRQYTFTSTDAGQPTKVADSTTEKDPAGNLVFAAISFAGGNGTWTGGGSSVHIQPHLHGPPQHNHFVQPTPSPSPTPTHSPSPVPSMTAKPISSQALN